MVTSDIQEETGWQTRMILIGDAGKTSERQLKSLAWVIKARNLMYTMCKRAPQHVTDYKAE